MNIFKLYDNKKAFEITFLKKLIMIHYTLWRDNKKKKTLFDMSKTTTLITPVIKKKRISKLIVIIQLILHLCIFLKRPKGLFVYICKDLWWF